MVQCLDGSGIGQLDISPDKALRAVLEPWLKSGAIERMVLCGMAGARNGLSEAPYVEGAEGIAAWRRHCVRVSWQAIDVTIAAGFACRDAAGRPEVMRGEETQLFGAICLRPELGSGRHVFLLPGTHSKWVETYDGRIIGFRTFLTGELFALLQGSSLLAGACEREAPASAAGGFTAGLSQSDQAALLGSLFTVRACQLRDRRTRGWAEEYLSGLLIGREVREARDEGLLGSDIVLIGDAGLIERYRIALTEHAISPLILDGDDCVLAGLNQLLEYQDADDR